MYFNIPQLISQYGYWMMIVGALLEGESFLIAGGIAAKHGLLSVPLLILIAWLGSMLHDFACFFMGRYAESWVSKRFPKFVTKLSVAENLTHKHGNKIILAMRFMYGLRVPIPVALGMMKNLTNTRFMVFDAIGGIAWSAIFVCLGYVFGSALNMVLKQISHFATSQLWWLLGAVLLIIAIIMMIVWLRKRRD